jgi:hypothetical protein
LRPGKFPLGSVDDNCDGRYRDRAATVRLWCRSIAPSPASGGSACVEIRAPAHPRLRPAPSRGFSGFECFQGFAGRIIFRLARATTIAAVDIAAAPEPLVRDGARSRRRLGRRIRRVEIGTLQRIIDSARRRLAVWGSWMAMAIGRVEPALVDRFVDCAAHGREAQATRRNK